MSDRGKLLEIKIEGNLIGKGRISVDLLSKVLKGLQTVIYHLGDYYLVTEYEEERPISKRGPFSKHVIETCTLEVVSFKEGSFIAGLELSENKQLELFTDIGEKAIQGFHQILKLLNENKGISTVVKDRHSKYKVMKALKEWVPKSNDYSIIFQWDEKNVLVDSKLNSVLTKSLHPTSLKEMDIFGRVIELKIIEDRYFTLLTNNKKVKCYYTEESEQEVIQAVGKNVWVNGEVILNSSGEIKSYQNVNNISLIEPGIFSISKVYWDGQLFIFKMPVDVVVKLDGELWILEYEPLDIICYEYNFDKVIKQFYEEIFILWNEFVEVEEDDLANDGVGLRNLLKELVEKVVGA